MRWVAMAHPSVVSPTASSGPPEKNQKINFRVENGYFILSCQTGGGGGVAAPVGTCPHAQAAGCNTFGFVQDSLCLFPGLADCAVSRGVGDNKQDPSGPAVHHASHCQLSPLQAARPQRHCVLRPEHIHLRLLKAYPKVVYKSFRVPIGGICRVISHTFI